MACIGWPVVAAPPALLDPGRPVPGLIVKLREDAVATGAARDAAHEAGHGRRQAAVAATLLRLGARSWRAIGPVGRRGQRIDFDRALGEAAAQAEAARLRASGDFEWVVLNRFEQRQQVFPSDPLFSQTPRGQWWLRETPQAVGFRGVPDMTTAWQRLPGSADPPVAVLDTGITAHPDLGPAVTGGGWDLVRDDRFSADGQPGRDADPRDPGDAVSADQMLREPYRSQASCEADDSSWHGTIIAGVLGATTNNAIGVAGLNPFARVLPVRVAGQCGTLQSDLIDGMRWAAGLPVGGLPANPEPARVLNVSFGSAQPCDAAYQEAIDEVSVVQGALVVAAAGNGSGASRGAVIRPANCRGVVAVAALHAEGFKATYSSFGPEITLATVGGDPGGRLAGDGGLVTVFNEGKTTPGAPGYAAHYGTSFAAPMVGAAVSLMLGLNPDLSPAQIIEGLRRSARPHAGRSDLAACSDRNTRQCNCTSATCGAGILDVPAALAYAADTPGTFVPGVYVRPRGGGGASQWGWALALGAAVAALRRRLPRPGTRGNSPPGPLRSWSPGKGERSLPAPGPA
jgi:serine protease